MAYLEWSRACTARVRESHVQSLGARAQELSLRLAREVDAGLLPFLRMGYVETLKRDMPRLVEKTRPYKHMLVLGIGGSALGTRAMQKAFARGVDMPGHGGHEGKQIWIADNVCPTTLGDWFKLLDPQRTVVVTISKSGGTIETISQYFLAREWLQKALREAWKDHMIVVTDLHKGFLREEASRYGLDSLEVPDNLGGRYSALSAVGLLPAAFLGIDWQALLDGAASVARPLAQDPSCLAGHPAFHLACWANALESHGYSQLVFFCYVPQWSTYGPWFAQLWAESLGKDGKGIMPVPATGVTDQHSVNQMFLDGQRDKGCIFVTAQGLEQGRHFGQDLPENWSWLRGKPFGALLEAEGLGTRMALCKSGVPLLHMEMGECTPRAAGSMMLLLEAATVFTGWLMGINPLDQPAVELGKRLANARLGKPGYAEEEALLERYLKTAEKRQDF